MKKTKTIIRWGAYDPAFDKENELLNKFNQLLMICYCCR